MYIFVIGYRSRPIQSYLFYKFYQLSINRLFVTNICALRSSKLPLSLKSDARMEYLSKFNKFHLHYDHYPEKMKNNFTESNHNISPLLHIKNNAIIFFYFALNNNFTWAPIATNSFLIFFLFLVGSSWASLADKPETKECRSQGRRTDTKAK